ncbi:MULTISPECIES: hypothetical protein [Paenibacillus]|uniref:Uncharacterized protein n=1 Tax=Paenibacillus residui TaxID=629724 RepID=A0ABW3D4M9_9BACL|nr:hypothetical protein [Paenibacillus sp. 32O-W]
MILLIIITAAGVSIYYLLKPSGVAEWQAEPYPPPSQPESFYLETPVIAAHPQPAYEK